MNVPVTWIALLHERDFTGSWDCNVDVLTIAAARIAEDSTHRIASRSHRLPSNRTRYDGAMDPPAGIT